VRRIWLVLLSLLAIAGCGGQDTWVYQLENYRDGHLDEIASAAGEYAVIDLARDGGDGWFRSDEIAEVHGSGKQVLAYFSTGSSEKYRPEHAAVARLRLNRWEDWPDEHFVRYWDELWWTQVVRPRLDRAIQAGFDGAYLDVPLAYEEIDLALVPGETRDRLARRMTALIVRASGYAKQRRPGFLIVPQNSPELRHQPGYLSAVDGIGMEDLFFRAHDEPCDEDWCRENLADVRALKRAGKFVLAVDYAKRPESIEQACAHYREEGFAGYVTTVELNRIARPC
jgi:cysteinyl-tRNA synthetase